MRKPILLLTFIAAACLATAQSGKEWVGNYVKALYAAKSLDATYTVQNLGGVPHAYHVQLSKPNLAKIETDTETITADGTVICTYNKTWKTYFKTRQTTDALIASFTDSELNLWQGFFDPNAMSKLPEALLVGPKMKGGKQLTEVDAIVDPAGQKRENFYFNKGDIPMQAEIKLQNPETTTLLIVQNAELKSEAAAAEKFAFNEPSGAHELSLSDADNGHWFNSLGDALSIATATHRLILLEFVSDGSPYCRQMEDDVFSQPEFQYYSKSFVFCRLNITKNPDLTDKYQVKGTPDMRFLNAKGQQVNSILGYVQKTQFLTLMLQVITANPTT